MPESLTGVQRLPQAALKAGRVGWIAGVVIWFVVLTAADIGLRMIDEVDMPVPPLVIPLVLVLPFLVVGLWWTAKKHHAWRFELAPGHLRVESGVIVKRASLLPRSRVQHVSTEQGPLQRSFGISSVTIHTAGARTPNVMIPGVEVAVAEAIRTELVGDNEPENDEAPLSYPAQEDVGGV